MNARMGISAEPTSARSSATFDAVQKQVAAMGGELFEVGLYKADATATEPAMIPRVWDAQMILKSVPWLRHQNRQGRNIYIRPKGAHDLSLVDDLSESRILAMKQAGFNPAVVVETSEGNYQAWLKHSERVAKEVSTAVARALAKKFGGDRGAADWRHFGRLAGFTNRKTKYLDANTGLYPFVRLIEAAGSVYPEAERFLAGLKSDLERRQAERQKRIGQFLQEARGHPGSLKSIDDFRLDGRYGGDGTRIDLAYAVYALAHGVQQAQVEAAIRSRDLSHKGNDRRQNEYVERTIKKALAALDRGR
jgi:hypothetical protein